MNYSGIKRFDISNGPGIRMSLYVSGCTHHCKGCFNPTTWNFNAGDEWTQEVEDKFIEDCKDDKITGVSILGGEPLQQDVNTMFKLLYRLKTEVKKPIWLWTGYSFDDLPLSVVPLITLIDVLVDGQFEIDKKDLNLKYCGSTNQRVIDMKETLKVMEQGEIVLYEQA